MTNNKNLRPNIKMISNRYGVNRTIAGGMGIIHLCEDTQQDNFPVALKTFNPKYLANRNVRAQFLREAAIWVELGWHPNIVQAYRAEYIPATRELYIVLEQLPSPDGKADPSLRAWLTPGRTASIEEALKLILGVTRGMKYATTKFPGLVHCDLKPDNIYLSEDGSARVGDFGLVMVPADILHNLGCDGPSDQLIRSSASGTPLYMSPEQWISRKVSISSDIYSLGCICLEMLTGGYTIRGRQMRNIAEEHIRGGALKRVDEANLPEALKAFLTKCLRPNSLQRFQSWESVEQEIIKLYDGLLHQTIEPEDILMDVSQKTQLRIGESILAIGESYLDMHEHQAAINCFQKARAIGKLQKSHALAASAETNIGLAFFKCGQYERAVAHYQRAIVYHLESGNPGEAHLNYGNVGNAYFRMGDYGRAQENITKVLHYTKLISDKKVKEFWKANLKNAIVNSGNKKMALEYFLYTLEVEQKFTDETQSVNLLDLLDRFVSSIGETKNHTILFSKHE